MEYCEVTSGWFYDEEFGWDYGSVITCSQQSVVVCIDTDSDDNPGGDKPIKDEPGSGSGPGDGGGGDPDCLIQDPYFEDLWIPCDDCELLRLMGMGGKCLTLEEQIIKDSSFEGTTADCIYEKLKSIDGFKELASSFEGLGTEFDVIFKIGATQSSTANGQAWYRGANQPIEITFNQARMNRSALEVARTIVHEMVHAEMDRAINTSNPTQRELDFRETFNTYVMMYRGSGDQHHNMMADEWVTKMGDVLKNVHRSLDPSGYDAFKIFYYPNGIPNHFYESVAWDGLQGTVIVPHFPVLTD